MAQQAAWARQECTRCCASRQTGRGNGAPRQTQGIGTRGPWNAWETRDPPDAANERVAGEVCLAPLGFGAKQLWSGVFCVGSGGVLGC